MRDIAAIAFVLLTLGATASAHHSFAAEFDADKPVKVVGTVTKVEWTNPHVWIYVDVPDASGKVVNWAWELGSPNGLTRVGWTRHTVMVGQHITVEGSGARDGGNTANVRSVTLNDTGQKLFGASSQPAPQ